MTYYDEKLFVCPTYKERMIVDDLNKNLTWFFNSIHKLNSCAEYMKNHYLRQVELYKELTAQCITYMMFLDIATIEQYTKMHSALCDAYYRIVIH